MAKQPDKRPGHKMVDGKMRKAAAAAETKPAAKKKAAVKKG